MAYQVLARKWRPQTFAEVVGQEHISRTLQNAILQQRVGHAYLFVGARGIGKTTSARIFAKALNCEQGLVAEPCCKCQSCLEIAAGKSLDVIEIDGASHNKVEDIRDIRDNVQYTPARSRYKIYIIDEVHMLTPAAWNALLKTLEEPPAHVKFLFATTEPHKVLPTIVSRCQRFDLRRIAVPHIVGHLRQIADGEGVYVEDGALAAIARAADGGMRDAQSIFDQMIAFCGGLCAEDTIREADVIDVFGLASGADLRQLAVSVLENDMDGAVSVVQGLAERGRDLERLFGDLIQFMRDVLVAAVAKTPANLLEVSESELEDLLAIGRAVDARLVQRVLQELVSQEWSFRSALNKRVYLEATLARVMLEAHSTQLDDVLAQLNLIREAGSLENLPAPTPRQPVKLPPAPAPQAVSAAPAPVPKAASAPVVEPPPPAPVAKKEAPAPEPPPVATASAPPEPEPTPEPVPEPTPEPGVQNQASVEDMEPESLPFAEDAEPVEDTVYEPISSTVEDPGPPSEVGEEDRMEPFRWDQEDVGQSHSYSAPPAQTSRPPADFEPEMSMPAFSMSEDDLDAETAEALDPVAEVTGNVAMDAPTAKAKLLATLEKTEEGRALVPLVEQLKPTACRGMVLQLGYDESVSAEDLARLRGKDTERLLQQCMQEAFDSGNAKVLVRRWLAGLSDDQKPGMRLATVEEELQVRNRPLVQQVLELFGGDVIDVRINDRARESSDG